MQGVKVTLRCKNHICRDTIHADHPSDSVNRDTLETAGTEERPREKTVPFLDPAEWEQFRKLADEMAADMAHHLAKAPKGPVWRPMPDTVRARIAEEELPKAATAASRVYEDFRELVLPYGPGNHHPRFWGWVVGSGLPVGALADFLASIGNFIASGFRSSPTVVEKTVIRWLAELTDFPADTSGMLVSGGSEANFAGLAVARNALAPFDVNEEGLQALGAPAPPAMVFYASDETHSSIRKAARLLGLGDRSWRRVPVDGGYRIDLDALRRRIREDRHRGLHPFCIVGNAGTVNTGSFDDLPALAEIARDEDLWFHVDAAFGAWAVLSSEHRSLTEGMSRADSLAFDLHKWMYVPYEAGCILVRDQAPHRHTFSVVPEYLTPLEKGLSAGGASFSEYGLQLSRRFRALKVWMCLKTYGTEALGRAVRENLEQARHLAELVRSHPALELLAPVPLNVVCFRYVGEVSPRPREEHLDLLNRRILEELQARGIAVPSHTLLQGRFVLRTAIANHRSRRDDFDALVEAVVELGRELRRSSANDPTELPSP